MATIMSNIWKTAGFVLVIMLLLSIPPKSSCQAPTIVPSGESIHYVGDLVTVTYIASQEYATVHWRLNNTLYDHSQPNIQITTARQVSFITFNNISQDYNNTAVRCEGSYTDGQSFSSADVTILLQGTLQFVTNLSASISVDKIENISWTAPYSIDVPSTDPDIKYCVDIYDTSAAVPTLIYSKCEINQTYHQCDSYPLLNACAEYLIEVIAVNNVGNSTNASRQVGIEDLTVSNVTVIEIDNNNTSVNMVMNAMLCPEMIQVKVSDVEVTYQEVQNNDITELEFLWPENRNFTVKIINENQKGRRMYAVSPIKTYDVRSTTRTKEKASSGLYLRTSFIKNSSAHGVLYALMYLNNNNTIDFSKSRYIPVRRSEAEEGKMITNVSSILNENYRILSYDIEENYQIQDDGYPADILRNSTTINLTHLDNSTMEYIKKETNYEVIVYVNCSHGFFQAIFQTYNDTIQSADYIVVKRARCSEEVIFFKKEEDIDYNIAVFPEFEYVGILSPNQTNETTEQLHTTDTRLDYTGLILSMMICTLLIMVLVILILVAYVNLSSCNVTSPKKSTSVQLGHKPKNQSSNVNAVSVIMETDESSEIENNHDIALLACNKICDDTQDENRTKNIPETLPPACNDELSDRIKVEHIETMNNPETMQTTFNDELLDSIKVEQNETENNPETMQRTFNDELLDRIKIEQNETENNPEAMPTTFNDELLGEIKVEQNEIEEALPTTICDELPEQKEQESKIEKYANVILPPSSNTQLFANFHRVECTEVLIPKSEKPCQARGDIVPIHDGSVDRDNILAPEPFDYFTPGFIHSFKNNFEMETPSDLTFADCDNTDDICNEGNMGLFYSCKMIVYDSPGLTPDFSDGLISFTECCNETCVYCTTMEYGESAHTLPESIVMKFDQVLGRSANNIVLAKKDMEYFYHYTILNIPELQKADTQLIREDLLPLKKVPNDKVAVLIEPYQNERWTKSFHIQLVPSTCAFNLMGFH